MRRSHLIMGSAFLALAAAPFLGGCAPKVSSMDCAAILDHAKQISQGQPNHIQTVENLHETSRNETDARCEGNATMSDNATGTIYLRAYEENGNTVVAYQGTPFN